MANQTKQLARLLVAEGIDVRVVRNNPDYRPAWIGRVRYLRAAFRFGPYLADLWRACADASLVHVMANSGWAWHCFAAPAIRIAALRRVPVVVNYRGGDADSFLAREIALVRPTLARARALVVPSGFLAEVFARRGIAATIVPNIVDLAAFVPGDAAPAAPHLVVTRHLEPIYDIATALRAFARVRRALPAATLTIAGDGPERSALEALAAQRGVADAVRFAGRLDNAALPALYRSASVAVNPSRVDNMPISVLEALACGVPVVSTNVGGVPYVLEHGRTALLVPPGDDEAMAQAVLRLHDEPALARTLRQSGIAEVGAYAWPVVRERLFEVYASVLSTPAAAMEPG
jgi:glycosyltransferase involved in cell wall biosynthesis